MSTQLNSRNYLVKMSAGSSDSSKVWNPRKPLVVGHPMRWTVEQAVGGVEVRSLHSSEKHFVKHSEIEKVASIVLAKGAKDAGSLKLELRLVQSVSSAHAAVSTSGSSLRIFYCKGDWTIDSEELKSSYLAKIEGRKVFKLRGNVSGIYAPTDTVELEALCGGVKFAGANVVKGEKRSIRFCDLAGSTLKFEGSEWKLAAFTKDTAVKPFSTGVMADAEQQLFMKTLKGALAATIVAGLLAWFMPQEEIIAKKEESVKILLKKKIVKGFATAAPKGDPNARDFSIGKKGQSKNAGKKGTTVAKNGKVSPAGERKHEQKVAKAAKAPAKAAAPKVAQAPKKSAPKMASAAPKSRSQSVASTSRPTSSKRPAIAASRPVPVPRSELFKTLSSSSLRKATAGLLAGGGASSGSHSDSAAEARSLGNSGGGSGRGALGGTGGVSTRSASVSGFGGGGLGDGDGGPGSAGAGYGRGSNSKVSGQGRSFVSMDTGASDVDEGLTRDQINRVISAHMNEIRYCVQSARLRDSDLAGRMTMKISIGAPGNVQTANVGNSSVGNSSLHNCIASRVKNWKFPKPKGGVTVGTEFPFTFKNLASR